MKLTNLHVLVSTLAAVAGVALGAYQVFAPQPSGQPLSVVVALDAQEAAVVAPDSVVEKSDVIPAIATESTDLAIDASFAAALKDGSGDRYRFASLFDGQNDTFLAIDPPDRELNILVTFRDGAARQVTAIEYIPPAGVDPRRLVTSLDVMVLPEGRLEPSGRPVISFSLPQSSESHIYAIPGRAEGRGLWLRVAGKGSMDSIVGDFRILSEGLAP